ncbi:MAG TPA: GNAT family N-acetyltransferase [Candidatus Sulfotelmatobacter sp.]|nr:GNAT family N-acetyltransferase [Candidatus Sulfotelmatobacter sp.]
MPEIIVRPLDCISDFQRCVQIAREVWADAELDTEPAVTYVIAHHTGGQVLGAFEGDTMVAFTKAYVGLHDQTPYLHSHMAAVLPAYRDRHIGRQLKLAQREEALRRGIRVIEWTFDPLETKNAHFNVNRLGAISRRYILNFYGITTSPLHRGMPTDRLLVEWHLDSPRAIAAIGDLGAEPRTCPARIHLPTAVLTTAAKGEPNSTAALMELQSRLRAEFTQWFAKGYAVTSVQSNSLGVDYCLSPFSDF